MEQYRHSKEEVLAALSATERGLAGEEAEARYRQTGPNALKEGKKKSKIALFFSQFRDLMTLILIAAAALSGVLAFLTRDAAELADTGILLFIIFLNALVGFLQQYRADAALEKLKKLSRCEAKVIRDGRVGKIDAERLVPGDVIELEEGDRVPADCRILAGEDLLFDESALTGESAPVKKCDCIVTKRALAERRNTIHLSTYCVRGTARAVVTATGMDTEMGRIAKLLGEEKADPSPLDRTIARLGKIISAFVLTVAGVLFVGGLFAGKLSLLDNIMAAVALAVAAIPEGMGAVVTVILAMGVQRMAGRNAVMRKLSAVEALGSCTVVCTDKTGTLTLNRMTVEEISGDAGEVLRCIRACNTVKGEPGAYLGDATEIALLEYADRLKFAFPHERIAIEPFTSERKMMSVRASFGGEKRLYAKGATEILLKKCTHVLKTGKKQPMTQAERRAIVERSDAYSARAMRVLAFAYGEGDREEELVFTGLAAMSDPPKPGAREAVSAFRRAGVKTVMITGDSARTALSVASRLGIAEHPSEVITGEQIDDMGSEKFAKTVQNYAVYARVSPKHKSEIVRALKARGETVAMTGDGVNDAPALKAADIGVAMGSGTDVTKNAADIVLADDDFSTMVHAVEEGRNVFFNIKKTIDFFLATNLAEVLCVLIVTLFFRDLAFLTSTQLLWVNLITDSLPVLALGVERTEGAMLRPPVSDREIYSRRSLLRVLFFGLAQTGILVGMFVGANAAWGNATASTMAFVALSLTELFHAFNVRNEDTMSKVRDFVSNRVLLLTVAVGILLSVLLVVTPLRTLFGLVPLSPLSWAAAVLPAVAVVPLGELLKGGSLLVRRIRFRPRAVRRRGSGSRAL